MRQMDGLASVSSASPSAARKRFLGPSSWPCGAEIIIDLSCGKEGQFRVRLNLPNFNVRLLALTTSLSQIRFHSLTSKTHHPVSFKHNTMAGGKDEQKRISRSGELLLPIPLTLSLKIWVLCQRVCVCARRRCGPEKKEAIRRRCWVGGVALDPQPSTSSPLGPRRLTRFITSHSQSLTTLSRRTH